MTQHVAHRSSDEIARLNNKVEQLRTALGWFVADERFQVGVGGNPNVVERMIEDAKAIYDRTRP